MGQFIGENILKTDYACHRGLGCENNASLSYAFIYSVQKTLHSTSAISFWVCGVAVVAFENVDFFVELYGHLYRMCPVLLQKKHLTPLLCLV